MASIGTIQFACPRGQFVNATGNKQYAVSLGSFLTEQIVRVHLQLGISAFFSWWNNRDI